MQGCPFNPQSRGCPILFFACFFSPLGPRPAAHAELPNSSSCEIKISRQGARTMREEACVEGCSEGYFEGYFQGCLS